MDEQEKGFEVKDKRNFDSEGNPRTNNEETKAPDPAPQTAKTEKKEETKEIPHSFPVNFATFVLSLATSAQIQLGLIDDPSGGGKKISLPAAKQTIDLLEMLQEKTKGNLDDTESKLMEHILYELRMQYVEKKGR